MARRGPQILLAVTHNCLFSSKRGGLGVRHDIGYSEESASRGISYLIASMDSVIEAIANLSESMKTTFISEESTVAPNVIRRR